MDMVHSTNTLSTDYRHYSLALNLNDSKNHHQSSQHHTYWQWQHSDGSSSEGLHQQSVINVNHWDTDNSPPPQRDVGSLNGPQSPLYLWSTRTTKWDNSYLRYGRMMHILDYIFSCLMDINTLNV